MIKRDWDGCYDKGWGDMVVGGTDAPDDGQETFFEVKAEESAYTHPAKFAAGLIQRIYAHGFTQGWWRAGDIIADPFAGIGCGGIIAAYKELRFVGVELEPRFAQIAARNFDMHAAKWRNAGDPFPHIILGDSREFAKLVGGCAAVVTSPPYADSIKGDHGETETAAESRDKRRTEGGSLGQSQRSGGYGVTEGNIGQLKPGDVDAVVTSPPFQDCGANLGGVGDTPGQRQQIHDSHRRNSAYGSMPGQIGNDSGDTYWQAVAAVYEQCRQVLKPGGMLVVVVKDHVKDGKRVPLCDDTLKLLVRLGFEPVERIRAWLVKKARHPSLFGGEEVETKSRKSFFRWLTEQKGSPHIDWEEVLCLKRTG